MDVQRYRRLHVALSLSLFVGCLTSRHSGTMVGGLATVAGVLIFSSLVVFLVGSSSSIHEAIVASLGRLTGTLFAPAESRRMARRVVPVRVSTPTLVLPFRFQLPPPVRSI